MQSIRVVSYGWKKVMKNEGKVMCNNLRFKFIYYVLKFKHIQGNEY